MQLKQFSLLLLVASFSSLLAQDQNILSQDKKDVIKYSSQKIEEDSSKLKKDWINPVTYTYTQQDGSKEDKSEKSVITISQPIFKSGGIYSAIKYASSLKSSNSIALSLDEKTSIKLAYQTLFNIHKTSLLIQKQKLVISNALIDIENKQESVLNGVLDISSLNNAILDANKQKESLAELEFQKVSLINSFDNLTSKSYDSIELPKLNLLDKQAFLKDNLYIKQSKSNSDAKKHLKSVTAAKYLPTVNANYTYTDNHTSDTHSDTYGISIVIPFDIKSYNDYSSSKLEYLKSKSQERLTIKQEDNFLKTQIAKVKMIEKKVAITEENISSYKVLLAQMKELEKAGVKTKDDVQVIENSQNAETFDIKIFEIDKQIELLELYARVSSAI